MSQFRNIKNIKHNKLKKVPASKSKIKQYEHIVIGDLFEQPRKRDQSPGAKQLLTNNINQHQHQHQHQIEAKDIKALDQELLQLWDFLGVTIEYRATFNQKLIYFNEATQSHLISFEKASLMKISQLIRDIIVDMISREDLFKKFRDAEIKLINESNLSNNNNLFQKINDELSNLKTLMIKIIGNVIKLRKMMVNCITKDKFNLTKMDYSYILEPTFIIKLNQSLQFLRDGTIGKKFNLKSKFDPLLLDLEFENVKMKTLIKYSNALLNELIGYNLVLNKGQSSASSIRSGQMNKVSNNKNLITPINNCNNNNNNNGNCSMRIAQKKEENYKLEHDNDDGGKLVKRNNKEKIECIDKEKDMKNQYDIDINMINNHSQAHLKGVIVRDIMEIEIKNKTLDDKFITKDTIECYTQSLDNFKQVYDKYYALIPSSHKSLFNLHENINQFTEGINPVLIVQYKQSKIFSLCSISTNIENPNALIIKHLSSLSPDLLEIIQQFIAFLQSNLSFKEITIDLYHENYDGKLQLRKEINDLFKTLRFRWSKLENLENGTRFQTMKYINTNEVRIANRPLLEISSCMIGGLAKDTANLPNHNAYLNVINKQMISALMNKSETLNEIKESFSYLHDCEGNEEDINRFLSHKGFHLKDFDITTSINFDKLSQMFTCCFELHPLFNTLNSTLINNYIYNRIQVNKECFYSKETNQSFYIIQQDNYLILIGEMTMQFTQYLNSKDNAYEAFNDLYSQFEERQQKKTMLWVPSFTYNDHSNTQIHCPIDTQSNIVLSSISNVSFPHCNYKDKTIHIEYNKRKEAIISNPFFLSIFNINQTVSVNNSIMFCCIADQSKWIKEQQ